MNKTKERIEYWLDTAEYDLDTAKALLDSKRYLYLGFICHLIVEKCIKAYFWHTHNSEPPYIHNLLVLSERSDLEKILTKDQKKLMNDLMPLNIQTRYPEEKAALLKTLNYNRCRSLYKKTREFYQWIEKLLK